MRGILVGPTGRVGSCQYRSFEECYPNALAKRGFCNPSPYYVGSPHAEHRQPQNVAQWSGAVGQVRGNILLQRALRIWSKATTFQISPHLFSGLLAAIATGPRDVRCYSILPDPKKWSILYRRTQGAGPILIGLCVSRLPHTRGVCAQPKAFGRSSVILTPSSHSYYEGGVGLLGGQSCSENSLPTCETPVHLRKRL